MSLAELTSAAGIISQLNETSPGLKHSALIKLDYIIDWFWHEIGDHVTTLELIWEDVSLPENTRQLAALVASKTYFHLAEYHDSMGFAIKAGPLFSLSKDTEYIRKTLATALDDYVELRTKGVEDEKVDPHLVAMVQSVFEKSISKKEYREAIGLSLESRRLDLFKRALEQCQDEDRDSVIAYSIRLCTRFVKPREWRDKVLKVIIARKTKLADLFHCLILLNNTEQACAEIRKICISDNKLIAYQLAFDLFQDAPQTFLENLGKKLSASGTSNGNGDNTECEIVVNILNGKVPTNLRRFFLHSWNNTDLEILRETLIFCRRSPMLCTAMVMEHAFMNAGTKSMGFLTQESVLTREATNWFKFTSVASLGNINHGNEEYAFQALEKYLPGPNGPGGDRHQQVQIPGDAFEAEMAHFLDGLADPVGDEEWEETGEAQDEELEETGESQDEELEETGDPHNEDLEETGEPQDENLEETGEPKGEDLEETGEPQDESSEEDESSDDDDGEDIDDEDGNNLNILLDGLEDFIDINRVDNEANGNTDLFNARGHVSAGYTEGGALFALGIIHANRSSPNVIKVFMDNISSSRNSVITHGACLGLGLTAMGMNRADIVTTLEASLVEDDAVIGEAAGIALGLVQLGNLNDGSSLKRILEYAQLTQHEKILRGIAVGVPLICFGLEEKANDVINGLIHHKEDAVLRRAGAMCMGMAYAGTGYNNCVKKLLQIAVTDNVDDVRRVAVIAIGFVLCGDPEQSLSVLQLLEDCYNPHVRYGVALALGISCAGTGDIDAINTVRQLADDPESFVRQGALIASALILVQQTENTNSKVKEFNDMYDKIIRDRYADELTKFGAILAQGIINSGGRNVTIASKSRTGHIWAQGVVGLFLFTHYWYWYPMALCLPLAFSPTCLIAVNKNLKVPQLSFISSCKPSHFAFPKPVDRSHLKVARTRCADAVLSFTFRELAKRLKIDDSTFNKLTEALQSEPEDEKKQKQIQKSIEDKSTNELISEPNSYVINNPARCLKQQLQYMKWNPSCRWEPVTPNAVNMGGFVVLKDKTPEVEVVEVQQPSYDPALQIETAVSTDDDKEQKEKILRAVNLLVDTKIAEEKSKDDNDEGKGDGESRPRNNDLSDDDEISDSDGEDDYLYD